MFQPPIIHTFQLGSLIKQYGLRHEDLGRIMGQIPIKNEFLRSVLKAQIAAECACLIIDKKMQQLLLIQQQNWKQNIIRLLNLILGNERMQQQCFMIWKVITLHSQIMYNCSLSQGEIHKGYFILTLVAKLNIGINPNTFTINNMFEMEQFLLDANFVGMRQVSAYISDSLLDEVQGLWKVQQISLSGRNNITIDNLLESLHLRQNNIPFFIRVKKQFYNKLVNILTLFLSLNGKSENNISIQNNNNQKHKAYQKLQLQANEVKILNFTQIDSNFILLSTDNNIKKSSDFNHNFYYYYLGKLYQFKSIIKQDKIRNDQNKSIANRIQTTIQLIISQMKIFYQYHPFYSQLYKFIADYYCDIKSFMKALQFSKKALSNIMRVCEGNSFHTYLSRCYFNISTCYIGLRRVEQALAQLKKARNCLQVNKQNQTIFYAIVVKKIVKLYILMKRKQQKPVNRKYESILSNLMVVKVIMQKQQNIIQYNSYNFKDLIQTYQLIQVYFQSISQINFSLRKLYDKSNKLNTSSAYNLGRQRAQNYLNILEKLLKYEIEGQQEIDELKYFISQDKYQHSHQKEYYQPRQNHQQNYRQQFISSQKHLRLQQFRRILRLIVQPYFRQIKSNSLLLFSIYIVEVIQIINRKGIQYNFSQSNKKKKPNIINNQMNRINQINQLRYINKSINSEQKNNKSQQNDFNINRKINKSSNSINYNIFNALYYIKNLIYSGVFILQLLDYVQNCQLILNQYRDKVRLSSAEGSKMFYTKNNIISEDSSFDERNFSLSSELTNLKQKSNNKQSKIEKFDIFMKSIIILVGDGYMMHMFD